jgi:NitT/TauT family transport system permease protein
VAAFVLLVVAWELSKAVVPDDGVSVGGVRVLPRTRDAAMPHVWTVLGQLGRPEVAVPGRPRTVGAAVASASAVHARGSSLGGLVLGGLSGSCCALVMLRSGWSSGPCCPTS